MKTYFVLEETALQKKMEVILSRVQKPARYVGGEWGSVMKDKTEVDLRFAFCFPDTYEVAMSHLGSRILYGLSLIHISPMFTCASRMPSYPLTGVRCSNVSGAS